MSSKNVSTGKAKSSRSPSKKKILVKNETNDFDLQTLIAHELAASEAPSASKEKDSKAIAVSSDSSVVASDEKKRKAVVISSDSSDVEILEIPPSPSKKRARNALPLPGSREFDLLAPVSFSQKLDEILDERAKPLSNARPKRAIVKTQKAKANEAAAIKTRLFVDRPKEIESVSTQEQLEDGQYEEDGLNPSESTHAVCGDSDKEIDDPQVASEHSDADILGHVQCADEKGKGKEASQLPEAAFSPEWEPFDEPSVPAGDDASGSTVAAGKYVTSDVDDSVEDGEIGVMSPDCQDPLLAQTYLGLPFLPHLCEITSFTGSAESLRTVFSDACAKMTKEEAQLFLRALRFVKSDCYINTARINPADLYVDGSRLRVQEKKNLAIGIMTGTVTESFLVASAQAGPRNLPYSIHKITIAPLEQDFRRDVSVWGMLFKFHTAAGAISPYGFSFATRGEGKGDSWKRAPSPSSPVSFKSSSLKSVSSPLRAVKSSVVYLSSRSFDDTIPVYDGRARDGRPAFNFNDSDFRRLASWPLYRKGLTSELPDEAIVSVGYSLGTYMGASGKVLSSNLQFIILLSVPKK